MILVNCASVNAVHAEQFELVFTVKSDKVVMNKAFLWEFVLEGDFVEVQAGAEIFLPADQ